ncbi:hypothetical protein VspSTUT11_40250 [Vibrio sp. STUT-A11]|nr:hypothetical protein VspSTUT11_40250 [Vibrio sp. STUT-A11]
MIYFLKKYINIFKYRYLVSVSLMLGGMYRKERLIPKVVDEGGKWSTLHQNR